jgi:AraC family transcriptional regulator
MPKAQPLTVDFTQTEDVLQVLPRPPLRSSENLGWNGIYVQQHIQPSWETPDYAHIRHMILVHGTQHRVRAERAFEGRRRQEQIGSDSNIAIVPATVQHQVNWSEESPFSLLFLEPDFLTQVAYESVTAERIQLIPQYAMDDR